MSKNIFAIIGSASSNYSNLKTVEKISKLMGNNFKFTIFNNLKDLPHFDPDLSINNPPKVIIEFRNQIEKADAILICTPEYIFSIPSGLKNALEWCVATTVFSEKSVGLIIASANGEKANEELQLIMKTVMTNFTEDTCLLISGIKGKFDNQNNIKDINILDKLTRFVEKFQLSIMKN